MHINKRNIVIDVSEINKSLDGDDHYDQLEELESSDHSEPAGLLNARKYRRVISQHESSKLSGTI